MRDPIPQHRVPECVIRLFGRPEIEAMINFFERVDATLSTRFLATHAPDERALTQAFLECLDPIGPGLHHLDVGWADLTTRLRLGGLVDVDATLTIDTAGNETVTRADLGIIVDFDDQIAGESWTKALLLQAKRLFRDAGGYSQASRYRSFSRAQLNGLTTITRAVSGSVGDGAWARTYRPAELDCARYLLYNPPWQQLAAGGDEIAHRQALLDNDLIYDYQWGLELHRQLDRGTVRSLPGGTLAVPLQVIEEACEDAHIAGAPSQGPSLGSVLRRVNARRCSLPWLVVLDLLAGHAGCCDETFVRFVGGDASALDLDTTVDEPIEPPRAVVELRVAVNPRENDPAH